MGDRRIRFCKACRRKFTPKNQKVIEPPRQEAESTVGPGAQAGESAEASSETESPKEPAQALAAMLPPPDQEWTS